MRTGAIFARGSCRALKWMALVGMVLALGAEQAAAQISVDSPPTRLTEGEATTITVEFEGYIAPSSPSPTEVVLRATAAGATVTGGLMQVTVPANAGTTAVAFTKQTRTFTLTPSEDADAADSNNAAVVVTWNLVDDGALTSDSAGAVPVIAPTDLTGAGVPVDDDDTQSYRLTLLTRDENLAEAKSIAYRVEAAPALVSGATTTLDLRLTPALMINGAVVAGSNATAGQAQVEVTDTVSPEINFMVPKDDDSDDTQITLTANWGTRVDGGTISDSRTIVDPDDPAPSATAVTAKSQADVNAAYMAARTAATGTDDKWTSADGAATIALSALYNNLPASGITPTAASTNTAVVTVTAAAAPGVVLTPVGAGSASITVTVNNVPVTFAASVDAAPTTTPTTATDGVITKVEVGNPTTDAPIRTIGGTKRVHVTEGALTKLTITGRWTHEQLATLYTGVTAPAKPTPAEVTVRVIAAAGTDLKDWLSPAETSEHPGLAAFGGQDVVLASNTVEIPIPAKPKTTENPGSPLYTREKSGSISLSLPHDIDAEDEGFRVEVVSGSGMGLVTDRTRSMWTTDPPVIVIEDDETQGIVLTLDPPRTTTATPRLFEASSYKFKAVAKPAREDLPLQVRYNVTDLSGVSVSSRLRQYTLTASGGLIPVGTGADAKDNVTLGLPANDGDREDELLQIHAEVVSFSLNSGAFDEVDTSTVDFTAVDVHKLPKLTVSPETGTVKEGGEIELTLMIDRNPANTTVSSTEKLEYTNEEITVMLTAGAGSTAGATDFSVASVKFPERKRGLYTAEMKVKVMALVDEEIDGGEMLVLDAMLKGSETENGSEGKSDPAKATLTIEDATQKLVYAKTQKEVEDAVYAAKKAAEGDDMKFTPGEMMEVMGSALFSAAEGVTVSYTAMSSAPSVASASVSGGTVMVTAATEGMAEITITAHGMSPSGVKILDQTDPDAASIMFPVEVGLEALSIMLSGPEDMNLAEGMSAMVTATANRAVTNDTTVMLMRDRSMSSASDDDFTADAIMIEAGEMMGSTMVMAVEDNMMEDMEELVLYGMTEGMAGEVTGEVKLYLWDAAVPALPIIAQLLLAAFLAVGGYRRYLRR